MSITDKEKCLLDICNQYHLSQTIFNKSRLFIKTPIWLKVARSIDMKIPILITFINFSSEGDHHEIHFASNINWSNDVTKDEKNYLTDCFKFWAKDFCRDIHPLKSINIVRFDLLPSIFDRHIRKVILYKAFAMKINNNFFKMNLGSNLNPLAILDGKRECFEQWKMIPDVNQIIEDIHSGMNGIVVDLNQNRSIVMQILDIAKKNTCRVGRNEFIHKLMSPYDPECGKIYINQDKFSVHDNENKLLNSKIILTRRMSKLVTSIIKYWCKLSNTRKKLFKKLKLLIIDFKKRNVQRKVLEKEMRDKEYSKNNSKSKKGKQKQGVRKTNIPTYKPNPGKFRLSIVHIIVEDCWFYKDIIQFRIKKIDSKYSKTEIKIKEFFCDYKLKCQEFFTRLKIIPWYDRNNESDFIKVLTLNDEEFIKFKESKSTQRLLEISRSIVNDFNNILLY